MADKQINIADQDQEDSDLRRMRWFILIILAIGFLCSIASSIAIILIVNSYLTLAVPSSQIIIMRPIICWLFPTDQHNKRRIA